MHSSDFIVYRAPHASQVRLLKGVLRTADVELPLQESFCIHPFDINEQAWFLDAESDQLLSIDECENLPIELADMMPSRNELKHTEFVDYVMAAKGNIADGVFQKAVIARQEFLSKEIQPYQSFKKALALYPDAFVYLLHSKKLGTWLGASPELFVSFDKRVGQTVALAGTTKDNADFSVKETKEQGIIGQYLQETLLSAQAKNIQIDNAIPHDNGGLIHLKSWVHFEIDNEKKIELIKAMHPTPAVGGYPKLSALDFIMMHEGNTRDLYAGWLGMLGSDSAQLYVNLRCAQLFVNGALLYAGCGINSMSDAEKEWQETCWKMEIIARCL